MSKYDKQHDLVGEESTMEKVMQYLLNTLIGAALIGVIWLIFVIAYGIDSMPK
jgi:hypothetical protein